MYWDVHQLDPDLLVHTNRVSNVPHDTVMEEIADLMRDKHNLIMAGHGLVVVRSDEDQSDLLIYKRDIVND